MKTRFTKYISGLIVIIFICIISISTVRFYQLVHASVCLDVDYKTYGGRHNDRGTSLEKSSDNGFIIVGDTSSYGAGMNDVYLIKTDNDGHRLWSKTFGGEKTEYGRKVRQTPGGGYIIVGYTNSFNTDPEDETFDGYLIKTDDSGDVEWHTVFGNSNDEKGYDVLLANDGGYLVVGSSRNIDTDDEDVYILKFTEDGNIDWAQLYGREGIEIGYTAASCGDEGYIIVGETDSYGAGSIDVYIIRIDNDGRKIWHRTYGGSREDYGYQVAATLDNNFILTGITESFGRNSIDILALKFDADGNIIWTRIFGEDTDEVASSIKPTPDGGYILTGFVDHNTGYDAFLWKINELGDTEWNSYIGARGTDVGYCVEIDNSSYVVAGYTNSYSDGDYDVYFFRASDND